jgi:hypothetical protein
MAPWGVIVFAAISIAPAKKIPALIDLRELIARSRRHTCLTRKDILTRRAKMPA